MINFAYIPHPVLAHNGVVHHTASSSVEIPGLGEGLLLLVIVMPILLWQLRRQDFLR